jgi:threonine synthase
VVISALKKLVRSGKIKRNQLTVAFITGAGPRTQDVLTDHLVKPHVVQPNLKSVQQALGI